MEIGGIKINLPKIGGNKAPKTEKYANLNEHAKDVYQKHSAEEVQQAMSEFSSLNTGEGRKFDFVDSCTFKYLYNQNLIDIDTVKALKDTTKFGLYDMSAAYQMKKDRYNDPKFFDKMLKAMDSIPDGRNATRFIQNKFEPTKEFTIGFGKEGLNKIEEIIDKQTPIGKYYKFDADSGKMIEETESKMVLHYPVQLKTRTFDYKNNKDVDKVENLDMKGFLTVAKQVVTTNDKDGNMIKKEIITPSEIKGTFDVEVVHANGKKEQISKASIQFVSGSPSLLCILHSMAHTEENLAVTSSLRCDCYSDNTFIL